MTLDDLLDLVQAAHLAKISRQAMSRHCRNAHLPAKKVGRSWITTRQAVADFNPAQYPPGKPKGK